MNVGAIWLEGHKEPLWVMGNLPAAKLVEIYTERMKIEQTFKDTKSLLNIEKVMNKSREQLESTLALVLLAYSLGLMIGEAARDEAYGEEGEKGGAETEKVEALLGTVRLAQETPSFDHEPMESDPGSCAGAMEEAFVPTPVRKCLISCPKVRSSPLTHNHQGMKERWTMRLFADRLILVCHPSASGRTYGGR